MGIEDANLYVSYAWEEEKENKLVDQLERACKQKGIKLIRDNNTIKYGDSISEYMQALGAGDGIIVVLSDAYLKSPNCMAELLVIDENQQFRERIFPIRLDALKINDPEVKVCYLDYWDKKKESLSNALQGKNLAHIENIQISLNLYDDIRRNADAWMNVFCDMYAMSEAIHRETNFEDLLGTLLQRLPGALSQDKVLSQFKTTVLNNIQQELDREPLQPLKEALVADDTKDHPAQWLCTYEPEHAIDQLNRGVQTCLAQLADQGVKAKQDREALWTGSIQILGWLVLLSVEDKWVLRHTASSTQDNGVTLEIPYLSDSSVEVVVARLTGLPAKFAIDTGNMDVSGKCNINIAIETGTSASDVVEQIAVAAWNKVYRMQETIITDEKIKKLNHTLRLRRERDNDNHYITVLKSYDQHPLNRTETYQLLCEKLSNLGIIFIKSETDQDVLLVPSSDLSSLVTEFLLLNHKYS